MILIKCWMIVMVGIFVAGLSNGTNHNENAHRLLCKVLREAVGAFKSERGSEALKKVLKKTIFGDENGGNLDTLKGNLPGYYNDQQGRSRANVCDQAPDGEYRTGKNLPWPGHSAPHDLVCLCTPGDKMWPFNNGIDTEKLCGQDKAALAEGKNEGWNSSRTGEEVKEQIKATWANVTKTCLESDGNGNDLNEALKDFIGKLEKKPGTKYQERYQLGEGESHDYPCGGNGKVCVMYHNSTDNIKHKHPMPWWTELQKAIKVEEEEKEKKDVKRKNSRKTRRKITKKRKNKTNPNHNMYPVSPP
ncbi:Variant surface glycoprotein [Trypanosoma congolense IL3000]|uniref:Variant surface glycoprotein n=1 Tax=Trypanosoma congolense (strain IL3000) TaxID=1068625 RepID=F9WBC8_TRYCI|nr:Variant surface glycoprotein [Trypanosoma congolense IL3000]